MKKLLSLREMELFSRVVELSKRLDECNPEVGLGPSLKTIADLEEARLSFRIDEDDIAKVCKIRSAGGDRRRKR